jgi:hypothetical protein
MDGAMHMMGDDRANGGPMTHADQHQMILELMDYSRKMKRTDQEDFDMFVKRDKDDEDLDQISLRRLRELYELYVPAHRRNF